MIAQYSQKVEPCKYTCKLLSATLLLAMSVVIIVHTFCFVALKVDDKTVEPFLNDILENLEKTPAGFLASVIIAGIGIYLMVCAMRGNVKLGLRFFFISFYPVVPKETFINSFMANCMVLNLWMASLVQFINVLFRGYLRGTQSAKIFEVQIRNMKFFGWFFRENFFIIFMLVWWFVAAIYLILKPVEKINTGQ